MRRHIGLIFARRNAGMIARNSYRFSKLFLHNARLDLYSRLTTFPTRKMYPKYSWHIQQGPCHVLGTGWAGHTPNFQGNEF